MATAAKKVGAVPPTLQVSISFARKGGALLRADVFVYSDPQSPTPKLVEALQFKDFKSPAEVQQVSLRAGSYAAISFITIREGINSTFEYAVTAAGQVVAELDGDAKKLSASDGQPDPLKHVRFFTV